MKTISLNERQVTELRCTLSDAAKTLERDGFEGLAKVAHALYVSICDQRDEQKPSFIINPTLQQGSYGADVGILKRKLGMFVDHDFFDCITENAVMKFQAAHGLKVDGIVGPLTWRKLLAL